MTSIEQRQLKGITVKNILVTVMSTASIVATVMGSYFQLRSDLHDMRIQQDSQNRITDIRLKVLESQVSMLQHQINIIDSKSAK